MTHSWIPFSKEVFKNLVNEIKYWIFQHNLHLVVKSGLIGFKRALHWLLPDEIFEMIVENFSRHRVREVLSDRLKIVGLIKNVMKFYRNKIHLIKI